MQAHKQQQQQQQQQQHRHHRRQSEFIQAAAAATAPSAQSSTAAEPAAPSPLGHMNTCTASWISDTPILKWFVATLKRLVFKPCHARPGHHVKWFAWCKCEATRCDVKNDALIWYLPNHDITRVHHAMSRTITVTDTAAPQQFHFCSTDSVSVQQIFFLPLLFNKCHYCSTNVISATCCHFCSTGRNISQIRCCCLKRGRLLGHRARCAIGGSSDAARPSQKNNGSKHINNIIIILHYTINIKNNRN